MNNKNEDKKKQKNEVTPNLMHSIERDGNWVAWIIGLMLVMIIIGCIFAGISSLFD